MRENSRSILFATIFAASTLGVAAAATADDLYTITRPDFSTAQIALKSIDASGIISADNSVTKFADIITLAHSVKADPITGLVLCTAGGERLVGTPQKLDGQSIVWFAAGVGNVSVPIDQCTGILRDRTADAALTADRADDQAKLANGDAIKGIVTDITDKGFVVTPQQGDAVTVPTDSVSSLLFATPPGGRKVPLAGGMIVRVTSGTIVNCTAVAADNGKATLTLGSDHTAVIPLQQILSIENASGPVRWMSARTPLTDDSTPFFRGDFPTRFDRSISGGPIRFGGTTYAHGIGVHSRSKLVFPVEPGDTTFRTRYAIDGNMGYADVNVRVLVDDKVIHAAKNVRAGQLSPVVQADVTAAKTVTLEVDYGSGFDVQDRLDWIEPAMIQASATSPATQP